MRNKTKVISLIALVAVVGLTIGFAAFSSTLNITSSATVKGESLNKLESDISNGVVTAIYACFKRNGSTYCLDLGNNFSYSNIQSIMQTAFLDIDNTNACSFGTNNSSCNDGSISFFSILPENTCTYMPMTMDAIEHNNKWFV